VNKWTKVNFDESDKANNEREEMFDFIEEILGKPAVEALLDTSKSEDERVKTFKEDLLNAMKKNTEETVAHVERVMDSAIRLDQKMDARMTKAAEVW
jgi:hypothetical protein